MTRTISTLALGTGTLLTAACSPASTDEPYDASGAITRIAYGDIAMADGTSAGAVKVVSEDGAVSVIVAPANLPDGPHGFHLHETGTCEGPDFKSAGGHLNPLGKAHGTESADGAHVGDLPNLTISANTDGPQRFPMQGTDEQVSEWLFDEDGTAVVIHAGPDDYKTDPSGAAGGRIACAVLTKG